jgi:hypothetical protein
VRAGHPVPRQDRHQYPVDIPRALASSGDLSILSMVRPGGGFVIRAGGLEAAVQDADQAVAELA